MLERITAREYLQMRCIAKKELIGLDREDARTAIVAQAFAGGKASDWMPPRIADADAEQTIDDMLAELIPVTRNGDPGKTQHPGER